MRPSDVAIRPFNLSTFAAEVMQRRIEYGPDVTAVTFASHAVNPGFGFQLTDTLS